MTKKTSAIEITGANANVSNGGAAATVATVTPKVDKIKKIVDFVTESTELTAEGKKAIIDFIATLAPKGSTAAAGPKVPSHIDIIANLIREKGELGASRPQMLVAIKLFHPEKDDFSIVSSINTIMPTAINKSKFICRKLANGNYIFVEELVKSTSAAEQSAE